MSNFPATLVLIQFCIVMGVTAVLFHGLRIIWSKRSRRRFVPPDARKSVQLERRPAIEDCLRAFGRSTNSIIHLYGDLAHFDPQCVDAEKPSVKALVGYVGQKNMNIAVTDPLCSPQNTGQAVQKFVEFSRAQKKEALFFAVSEATCDEAQKLGYERLKVGQEPAFDLKKWHAGLLNGKIRSAIRQAYAKGIVIEQLKASQLGQPEIATALNEVLDQWITTRRCDKMKVLSVINPFSNPDFKSIFVARQGSEIEGFLSCSAIPGRNGWFLHDLIRRPTALNGVSEALVVSALEKFQEQGYDFASLGIASLAGLDAPGVNSRFPLMNRAMVFAFRKYTSIVNFKQLYAFKKKFCPTHEEPSYLCFPKGGLDFGKVSGILKLFSEDSLLGPLFFKFRQWRDGINLPSPVEWLLDREVICLPPLSNLHVEQLFFRFKFTISMILLNVYTFVFTNDLQDGTIMKGALGQLGFSYASFIQHKWFVLVTSNFMHFDETHLALNMLLLAVFGSCLEALAGSTATMACYLIAMNANVPSGLVLLPILRVFNLGLWSDTVNYVDVGASLGVMGCLGGLCALLRPVPKFGVLSVAMLVSLSLAIESLKLIGIDHCFAMITGFFVITWRLNARTNFMTFSQSRVQFLHPGGKRPPRALKSVA